MLNEKKIQSLLTREYREKRKHVISVPNVFLYQWESDLLTITRTGYICEFEIKCSKWNYLNDFKKIDKHNLFKNLNDTNMPNYFYYVSLEGLINVEDIPEYAGLLVFEKRNNIWNAYPREVKKAPILHNQKVGHEIWEQLARKLSYKYVN